MRRRAQHHHLLSLEQTALEKQEESRKSVLCGSCVWSVNRLSKPSDDSTQIQLRQLSTTRKWQLSLSCGDEWAMSRFG